MFYISLLPEARIEYESIWLTAKAVAGARLYFHSLRALYHSLAARQMSVVIPKHREGTCSITPSLTPLASLGVGAALCRAAFLGSELPPKFKQCL